MPVEEMTILYPKELAVSHAYITCRAPDMLFSGCTRCCCTLKQMAMGSPQAWTMKEQMHEPMT